MLNNYYDRDIDRLMKRTSTRPLAADAVSAHGVLYSSLLLIVLSIPLMTWMVNGLAAWLTACAAVGYSVIYTMVMKRRTSWANQFGGIAGALPPVIGYAAVAGHVDAPAWILFAIMVIWQQPHALSLALKYRHEYAAAGVPAVPVAKGVLATKLRIVIYNAMLLGVALLPYVFGMAGVTYLGIAIALSSAFLGFSIRFLMSPREHDMFLFLFSILYLVVLFTNMVFDAL